MEELDLKRNNFLKADLSVLVSLPNLKLLDMENSKIDYSSSVIKELQSRGVMVVL